MEDLLHYLSQDSIAQIFKIDCFEKSEEAFKKTHYPLSFNYHAAKSYKDINISESYLLNTEWQKLTFSHRVNNGIMIRPFVVWGATGTGKTELCRYLELELKDLPDYLPIRVSKRDLAMGGILGIAQSLSKDKIDITTRLIQKDGGYDPVEFFKNALGILSSKLGHTCKDFYILEKEGHEGEVYRQLAEKIVQNIKTRAQEIADGNDIDLFKSKPLFLNKNDFNQHDVFNNEGDIIGELIINKNKINNLLYDQLIPLFYGGVSSVQKLLYDYISDVNDLGKIPVFIFDDVTFVGDKINELIPVITDISADSGYVCDFVIGTTSEFYLKHFKGTFSDTIQERISEIKLSPGESVTAKSAEWLLPDYSGDGSNKGLSHFLEFCLRYIHGTYIPSLDDVRNAVPIQYRDDNDVYYPFTKTFLINIYQRILYEMKDPSSKMSLTPRIIIKILYHVLISSFDTQYPLSYDMDASFEQKTKFLFKFNDSYTYSSNAEYYNAIWWYGEQAKGRVSITLELIERLGLGDVAKRLDTGKQVIEYDVIDITSVANPVSPPLPTIGIRPIDHSASADKSRIEKWMTGDPEAKIPTDILQSGIDKVIKTINDNFGGSKSYANFINPNSSRLIGSNKGSMYALRYAFKGNKNALFTLSRKPTEREEELNIIPSTSRDTVRELITEKTLCIFFTVDEYYNAIKLGGSKDKDETAGLLAELLNAHIDDFHSVLKRQNVCLRRQLEDALGCSLEAFVLSLYIVLGKLLNPFSLINNRYSTVDDILKIYQSHSTVEINRNCLDPSLSNTYPTPDDYDIAEGLFLSLFTLGGGEQKIGYVDYPKLKAALAEIRNPYQIIKRVKAGDISDDVVISKGKSNYKDTFKTYVKNIQKSLSTILSTGWKFDDNDYELQKEKILSVGEYRAFRDSYLDFAAQLPIFKKAEKEVAALRRAFNKISGELFVKTKDEFLSIESVITSLHSLPSDDEKTIVELLCSYLLNKYLYSDIYEFLTQVDAALDLVMSSELGSVATDLGTLKRRMSEFISVVEETK